MIVVTGARGQVGSRVNEMLENLSLKTIPVSRAEGRTPGGGSYYVGDLSHPSTMRDALEAGDQIFLYPDFDREFVALLAASRIRRVVLLSSAWVEVYPDTVIAEKHLKSELMLLEAGIEFTILRPDTFMTNDHFWMSEIRQGRVATAFPSALTAPIACADIAGAAVEALHHGAFANEHLLLTGGQALTQRERIQAIADHLGTSVEVEVIDEQVMRERFAQIMPPVVANSMIDGMQLSQTAPLAAEGAFTRAMGRAAVRYHDWLRGDESKYRKA